MTIIYFILILGLTVFIHEFGHFICAKKAGIYVYEFSVGMGPLIHSFKRNNDETQYSIRLFPIGGYVQMAGEEVELDKNIPENKRMQSKSWFSRFITVVAGVLFNFLLAIIIFFIVGLVNGASKSEAIIGKVYDDTPAYTYGLKENDRLLTLNGNKIDTVDRLSLRLAMLKTKDATFTVKRDGKVETIKVKADVKETDGTKTYSFGFSIQNNVEKGFLPALKYAFYKFGSLVEQLFSIIFYLITGQLSLSSLSGPIGIYQAVGTAAKSGLINVLYLFGYISLNVGIVNLLPLPAFDGGRALFMIIEAIRGKQLDPKVENTIHSIGFILLMILMVLITFNDIIRLFK